MLFTRNLDNCSCACKVLLSASFLMLRAEVYDLETKTIRKKIILAQWLRQMKKAAWPQHLLGQERAPKQRCMHCGILHLCLRGLRRETEANYGP